MRIIILFILITIISNNIFSQDTTSCFNDSNTGFVSDDIDFSGHAIVFTAISKIKNENIAYLGGGGAIMVSKKYLVGAFGTGLLSNPIVSEGSYKGNTLELSYMGLWLGYSFLHEKRIHPIISSQFAIGGLSLTSSKMPIRDFYDNISIINPIIEIEATLSKYIRISAGGQYSYFMGVDELDTYSDKSFNYPGVFVSLKIGWE